MFRPRLLIVLEYDRVTRVYRSHGVPVDMEIVVLDQDQYAEEERLGIEKPAVLELEPIAFKTV